MGAASRAWCHAVPSVPLCRTPSTTRAHAPRAVSGLFWRQVHSGVPSRPAKACAARARHVVVPAQAALGCARWLVLRRELLPRAPDRGVATDRLQACSRPCRTRMGVNRTQRRRPPRSMRTGATYMLYAAYGQHACTQHVCSAQIHAACVQACIATSIARMPGTRVRCQRRRVASHTFAGTAARIRPRCAATCCSESPNLR